jgi:hypothetical protein
VVLIRNIIIYRDTQKKSKMGILKNLYLYIGIFLNGGYSKIFHIKPNFVKYSASVQCLKTAARKTHVVPQVHQSLLSGQKRNAQPESSSSVHVEPQNIEPQKDASENTKKDRTLAWEPPKR